MTPLKSVTLNIPRERSVIGYRWTGAILLLVVYFKAFLIGYPFARDWLELNLLIG